MNNTLYQVRIELLRVQTFLFAVPRLRDMIGANVLLGEALRHDMSEMSQIVAAPASPMLLKVIDAALPNYPQRRPKDPLANTPDPDDPRALLKAGILARDGGHFYALFEEEIAAEEFSRQAENLLRNRLPGLAFEIEIVAFGADEEKDKDKAKAKVTPERKAKSPAFIDLPVFEVCQESGNGAAQDTYNIGTCNDPERVNVSNAVKVRKERGRAFASGEQTQDIIGLLRGQLPLRDSKPKMPKDFADLCGNDYLAVIHADGNGIGLRYNRWKKQFKNETSLTGAALELAKEGHGEQLYHSMRVAVRRAVLQALGKTFPEDASYGKYRPYQLLMLGGDDLLMVCRARYALRFVVEYARALRDMEDIQLADGKPLSIGAGVVIARPSVPFHRLYHLAEELASSAKRLYRSCKKAHETDAPSVVDWMIFSESWSEDPIDQRRADCAVRYGLPGDRQETLALTGKPYRILDRINDESTDHSLASLAGLLKGDEILTEAARSQLRYLVAELHKGRRWGDLCWRELPKRTRDALDKAGVSEVWEKQDPCRWQTRLLDLVELYEIQKLGVATQPTPTELKQGNEQSA